jgi:transposase-like protein
MNTPITEAQYQLAHEIRQSSYQEKAAQLIADSEAQAVEPWRTQVEELRGALALGQENCDAVYDELRGDCDELSADVVRLTAERDQLRAEVERCNDIINRASVQFFHDGADGKTAAKMLTVLNEAKP